MSLFPPRKALLLTLVGGASAIGIAGCWPKSDLGVRSLASLSELSPSKPDREVPGDWTPLRQPQGDPASFVLLSHSPSGLVQSFPKGPWSAKRRTEESTLPEKFTGLHNPTRLQIELTHAPRVASVELPPARMDVTEEKAQQPGRGAGNNHDIGLGLAAGVGYLFPTARFQYALSEAITVGVMPIYAISGSSTSSQTVYGGLCTGTYYFRHSPFTGPFAELGTGIYSISAKVIGSQSFLTAGTFSSTLGWRWRVQGGFNVGAGAGMQYVFRLSRGDSGDIDFRGLMPLLNVDVGYGF